MKGLAPKRRLRNKAVSKLPHPDLSTTTAWVMQIIVALKKLDETRIGSQACKAGVEVEESF